jgi:hypothetical protein
MAAEGDAAEEYKLALAQDIEAASAEKAAAAQAQKSGAMSRSALLQSLLNPAKLNPAALAIIGIAVALGAVAFAAYKMRKSTEDAFNHLMDLLNPFKNQVQDQTKQFQKAVEIEQEYAHWQNEINSNRHEELELFDRKLDAMKREASAQRELMKLQGASASDLNRFDLRQLQMEKEFLESEQARIDKERQRAHGLTESAKAAYERGATGRNGMLLGGAESAVKGASDILEAAKIALKGATVITSPDFVGPMGVGSHAGTSRPANESDVLTFKVGEGKVTMSVEQATAALNEATADWKALSVAENNLKNVYDDAKSTEQEKANAAQKLSDAQAKVAEEMAIAQKYGGKIATLEDAKQRGGLGKIGTSDSLVRVGNFLGSSKGQIDTMADELKKANQLAREANRYLGQIADHTKPTPLGSHLHVAPN